MQVLTCSVHGHLPAQALQRPRKLFDPALRGGGLSSARVYESADFADRANLGIATLWTNPVHLTSGADGEAVFHTNFSKNPVNVVLDCLLRDIQLHRDFLIRQATAD